MYNVEKILYTLADKNQFTIVPHNRDNNRENLTWRFAISPDSGMDIRNVINDMIEINFFSFSNDNKYIKLKKTLLTEVDNLKSFIIDWIEKSEPKKTSFKNLCPLDKQTQYDNILRSILKTPLDKNSHFLGKNFLVENNHELKWRIERELFSSKYEILIEENDRVHVIKIIMPESISLLEYIKVEASFLIRVNNKEEILTHKIFFSLLSINDNPLLELFKEKEFNKKNSLEETINYFLENSNDSQLKSKLSYIKLQEDIQNKDDAKNSSYRQKI